MRYSMNRWYNLFLLAVVSGAAFFFSGCTKCLNENLRETVMSKPHDERLFGWWASVNDEDHFICFDDEEFKYIDAYYGIDGTLISNDSEYWYTEDNILHLCHKATPLTRVFYSWVEYTLSEDLQTLYEIDDKGNQRPSMIRAVPAQHQLSDFLLRIGYQRQFAETVVTKPAFCSATCDKPTSEEPGLSRLAPYKGVFVTLTFCR